MKIRSIALLGASLLLAVITKHSPADSFYTYSDEQLLILQQSLTKRFAGNLYVDDTIMEVYLNNLGDKVSINSRNFIFAENTSVANAFASWGNLISINMGMLDFVESEAELAGILAHEDSHIQQGHFTRLIEGLKTQSGLTVASILVALLSDGVSSADIINSSIALQKSQEFALRRRYEREADRQSINKLRQAGYTLADYISLLDRLSSGQDIPDYARTHPASNDRIAELKSRNRSLLDLDTKQLDSSLDFWLIQERARSYLDTTQDSKVPTKYAELVRVYGTVIQSTQPNLSDLQILKPYRDNWIIAIAIADALLKLNDLQAAIDVISSARKNDDTHLALLEKHLLLLAEGKKLVASKLILAGLPNGIRNNRRIALAESKLWEKLGDQLGYRVALSYALFGGGRLNLAKEQIKLARAQADSDEVSTMTGRLDVLENKIALFESLPIDI